VANSVLFQAVEAELGHFKWQELESHYKDILQLKLNKKTEDLLQVWIVTDERTR
jgi:hypothetical protein